MRLSTFLVADGVRTGLDGKLYVFGGQWDRIFSPQVPHTQMIALALVLDVGYDEALEPHTLRLTAQWEDGEKFGLNISSKLNLGHPPGLKRGADFSIPVSIDAQPFTLDRYGRFEIDAELDGTILGRRMLELASSPPFPATLPGMGGTK